ncbi:hypothetical protein [Streptomyces sp. cmx-4-9]|uniref:hypothetical protein n=1 Tax=Streptomyces sp. cmx-4-9 TaxID=2790941 RepID=UPI0039804B04
MYGTRNTKVQAAGCVRAGDPAEAAGAAEATGAAGAAVPVPSPVSVALRPVRAVEPVVCGEPDRPDAAGPAARGPLGCLSAAADLPGLPDPKTLLGLLGAWHGRGVQVGFPELSGRRP